MTSPGVRGLGTYRVGTKGSPVVIVWLILIVFSDRCWCRVSTQGADKCLFSPVSDVWRTCGVRDAHRKGYFCLQHIVEEVHMKGMFSLT